MIRRAHLGPGVCGDSAATGYWTRYAASRQVFQGEWLRTGDTYVRDADGFYVCLGRTGDMLKVSGIWVAPGIESFKRPRRIVFVEAYPTTATGKVRRVELRETARRLLDPAPPQAAAR